MCGITAVVDKSGEDPVPTIEQMTESLRHRGPDDTGIWQSPDRSVALGHRRLSIVDLSVLGRNPMTLQRGSAWITYNGEIYNYRTLREELRQFGYSFRTDTDTEVVLAAYDRWQLACLDRFVGMFGFVLWDGTRDRLVFARDRLGKKPLYYAIYGDRLAVASELKAIVADAAFPRDIDPSAIPRYLRYGYVPSPGTIYRHASKLPPGHYAVYEGGCLRIERYWDPVRFASGPRLKLDPVAAEERLEELLRDAVSMRMIADVPLGAFLSGGIDSSLVVALMQELSGQPVSTFTVRFADAEYNEADHAAAVARHLGTKHEEQTCSESDMLAVIDRLPDIFDEPFADSSAVPLFLLSRVARRDVTVALSGDGGDELFFGYPRYRYHADAAWALALSPAVRGMIARGAARLPTRRLRRIADVLNAEGPDPYQRFIDWWQPAQIQDLTGRSAGDAALYEDILARSTGIAPAERPGLLDLVTYLPDDILTKVDRASMAVSLEVRAPLLDHRIVEFALGLPLDLKRQGGTTKWLLRRLLFKRVPRQLVDRPKMGFGVPLDAWFRGELASRMHDYCNGHDLEDLGVNPAPVRALWADFQIGRSHRADLLWQVFCLVAWARRFNNV